VVRVGWKRKVVKEYDLQRAARALITDAEERQQARFVPRLPGSRVALPLGKRRGV